MGFLEKAKEAAAQASVKAQQGLAQGQAKVDEIQTKRKGDALLRDLGAAYYAQQRTAGSAEQVTAALSAVDAHVATNGPIDSPRSASGYSSPPSYGSPPPAPGAPVPPTQPGGYGLDDI